MSNGLEKALTAAKANGWTLLASTALYTDEVLTLCNMGGGYHPFVSHRFNPADGGFYHGYYHATQAEAEKSYNDRAGFLTFKS